MGKSMWMFLAGMLSACAVMANDFQVKVRLGEHRTDNLNGVWSLEKKSAKEKKFQAKVIPKSEFDIYPCLGSLMKGIDCSDIKIIDRPYFKKYFVDQNYYHFHWKKRKNQGYSDPNGEAINTTISPIPQVMIYLNNRSGKKLTLLSIKSKSIYQQGGMADSSEHKVKPKVRKGAMEISHNKSDMMTFPKDYVLSVDKAIELPLSLWVKNAAHGDGTGDLAYALELKYVEDGRPKKEVLVRLLQGDAEGYDVTAGGIAPLN